jgi:predicted amidophosphoribosyltransferase
MLRHVKCECGKDFRTRGKFSNLVCRRCGKHLSVSRDHSEKKKEE